jgi:hypothetical protein
MNTTINCPKCGEVIEIDKALAAQFSSAKAVEIQKEAKERAEQDYQEKLSLKEAQLRDSFESDFETQKIKLEAMAEKQRKKQEFELQKVTSQLEASEENGKELTQQISDLLKELQTERKSKENVEIEAQRKMLESEKLIRDQVREKVDEEYKYKLLEKDQIIGEMKIKVEEAKKTAENKSQQLQGEVLELDLERELCSEFPFDDIAEIKKGASGADIKHQVNDTFGHGSGLIIWEAKNATNFSNNWVDKLKGDISSAGADFGVIVWLSTNNDKNYDILANNIWVVKPKLAIFIAHLLINQLVAVAQVNKTAEFKDQKMAAMYKYVTGPEFKNRIESILTNYTAMKDELEKEKRATQLRWNKMDKMLRAMIDNTIGVYGDFQGLTNSNLMALPSIEEEQNKG